MRSIAPAVGIERRLRRRVAPAAKSAMLRCGVFGLVRSTVPSRQLAILRYHAICGSEGHEYASPQICISPAAFDEHMRYLSANYHVLPLPAAVAALNSGHSLPPNAVALTFDDGYADNFAAAEVMLRYGVTGTFYITAGCLEGDSTFWPAEVRYLVAALPGPAFPLESEGQSVVLPLATDAEREVAVRTVTRLLKSRAIPERERLRDVLRAGALHPNIPDFMLTWDQVRQMHRMGMTIGAHTLTHPNLPSAGMQTAQSEIQGSRERLEYEIGAPVTMFSYPNGGAERYFTPELQRVVRESGFVCATTSRNGFAGHASDAYALERVQVHERMEDLLFTLEIERFAFRPR